MHHNNITITLYFVSSHAAPVHFVHPQHSDPMLTAIFCKSNIPLTSLLRPMDGLDYTAASILANYITHAASLQQTTHPFYESIFHAWASLGALQWRGREGTDQYRHCESWCSVQSSQPTHTEPNSTRLKDTSACAGTHTILSSHLH